MEHMGQTKGQLIMEDYQDRVINEAGELEGKIGRLGEFINMARSAPERYPDFRILLRQLSLMEQYHAVLTERIAGFSSSEDKPCLDKEFAREDGRAGFKFGLYEPKPIESLTVMLSKYTKDIAGEINFMIADFDTCLGITNHLYKTRDIEELEFADVFKFIERQMSRDSEQLEEDVNRIDEDSVF